MAERVEIRVEAVDAATNTFNEMAERIRNLSKPVEQLEANARKAGLALKNLKVDPLSGKVSYTAVLDNSEALKKSKEEAAKLKAELKASDLEADRLAKRGDFLRTMFANLTANLLASTLGMAANAAGNLVEALGSAGKFQTQSIAAAQDIATNLNTPLDVAKGIVEKSQIEIAKLAASLPGETEDYSNVFNSLSGTLAANFRGNAEGFQTAALDMTKRVSALAAIRGQNASDAGSQAMRFLAGTATWGESVQQDLFQKNPQLQRVLRQVASEEGVTLEKWKQLSDAQRYKIFNKALTLAAPDSLFEAFQGTYESVTQTIKTALVDPQMGIFGVLRKVDLSGGIETTVLDQAAGSLQALFDLFNSLGTALKGMGFNFDPMESLASTLNTFTGFVRGLDAALQSMIGGGSFDLSNAFGFDIGNIGGVFNGLMDNFLKQIQGFKPGELGAGIGKAIGSWMNMLTKFTLTFDYGKFGQILMTLIAQVGLTIGSIVLSTITSINWLDVLLAILKAPFNLLAVVMGAAVGYVTTQINFVLDGVKSFFQLITDLFEKAKSLLPNLGGNAIASGALSAVNPVLGGAVGAALDPMAILRKLTGQEEKPTTPENPEGTKKVALLAPDVKGKPLAENLPASPIASASTGAGTFAPSINVHAANVSDPEELANLTLQKLASAYDQWERQKLS